MPNPVLLRVTLLLFGIAFACTSIEALTDEEGVAGVDAVNATLLLLGAIAAICGAVV